MFGFGKKKDEPNVAEMSNDSNMELEEVGEGIVSLARREIGPGELSEEAGNQYRSLINSILASTNSREAVLRLVSMSDLSQTMTVRMTALLTINDYLSERYQKSSEILLSFIINICASSIAKNRMGRREIVSIMGGEPQSTYQEPPKRQKWWHRLFS